MKKICLLALPALMLASCSFSFGSDPASSAPTTPSTQTPTSTPTPSSSEPTPSSSEPSETSAEPASSPSEQSETSQEGSEGSADSSETETSGETTAASEDSSSEPGYVPSKVTTAQTYLDLTENNVYYLDACPTIGKANLLVIPVWFSDSSTFIATNKKENVREDIEKAYFGTPEETGWHSVKSFYEEESNGRLTIDGVVSDWYDSKVSYKDVGQSTDMTDTLVKKATNWFFNQPSSPSRSNFDSDGNGLLDAVMLIYAAPDYMALNNNHYDNLWAYCYWLQDDTLFSQTSPGPNTYFWASYDFLYSDGNKANERAGSRYGSGDTSHCDVDAHTFIHEMGHCFGLDDYYDYTDNENTPAGGFTMQDWNIGGHDPYSVMAFGWADPYIPTEECEITLRPFQDNRDLILLTPEWNEHDSPFDEYLLLEFYTPTNLNEFDATYNYSYYGKGPSQAGIRLWHVDARLAVCTSVNYSGDPIYSSELTTDCFEDTSYGLSHAFNNNSGGERVSPMGDKYKDYDLLHFIRNDKNANLKTSSMMSSSDFFRDGDSFTFSNYKSQFPNGKNLRLDNGKSLGWNFSVSIEGTGDNLVAKVDLSIA